MTSSADDQTSTPDDSIAPDPAPSTADPLDPAPADTLSLDEAVPPTAAAPTEAAPTAAAPTEAAPTVQSPSITSTPSPTPTASSWRPPVRWAGIVWGAVLTVFAITTLVVVSSPVRLAGVTVWMASLTPGATWALWIALLGLVIVVSALLAGITAAQRSRRRGSV